jgi:multimeric flavodoxin WrbA
VNGSPRRERSNTQRLLGPLLEGAREDGAEVEHVYLRDLDVRPCTGCMSCWTRTPGRCVQDDDMAGLLESMLASDALVFGFPLYIFGPPAGVQAMLERMLPLAEPWLVRRDGLTGHPMRREHWRPAWIAISNCGFPEQDHFDALERKFAHMGARPIVMGAGEFLPAMERDPELAAPWEALRSALAEAGREVARTGDVPDELRGRLCRPVIEWAGVSAEEYIQAGNEAFERALKVAERRRGKPEA